MSQPIRVAILGLDHWYAAIPFAERVAGDPATELVGIADADQARAQEVAANTGCGRVETDPAAFLTDDGVDAVACFTSVDRSPDLCIAAAAAGKHIVSVKPCAMTLDQADAVVDAVDKAGVIFIPSEARHTSALALRLTEMVRSGALGDLRSGTFQMNSSLPQCWPGNPDPGWWADPACAPGGAWLDHAVYQIDRMRWLFGSPIARVEGCVARIACPDLPVEDYGHAIFTLESGAVVTIEDTWIAANDIFANRGELVGSKGSVFYDTATETLGVAVGSDEWALEPIPDDSFDTFDVLVRALRDGVPPTASVRDARATLAVCLDFYRAAKGL